MSWQHTGGSDAPEATTIFIEYHPAWAPSTGGFVVPEDIMLVMMVTNRCSKRGTTGKACYARWEDLIEHLRT